MSHLPRKKVSRTNERSASLKGERGSASSERFGQSQPLRTREKKWEFSKGGQEQTLDKKFAFAFKKEIRGCLEEGCVPACQTGATPAVAGKE